MRISNIGAALLCAAILNLAGLAAAEEPSPADAARADIKATLGFVPEFLAKVPDNALPGAWAEMKGLQMNPNTALPPKIKELIGLAVAAQIPCEYCIYAHKKFCSLSGGTDAEMDEAIVMSALTRHWSTIIQGNQTWMKDFKASIDRIVAQAKKSAASGEQPPAGPPADVTDAASTNAQIKQMFGEVPGFMQKVPPEAAAGAWKTMRDVEMNPNTAIPGKYKSLIGLAVASQVPCKFCNYADTEFAKLEGATDREIHEAIAMAAITRFWSTWLNGSALDKKAFQRDIDKLVRNAERQMKQQAAAAKREEKTVARKAQ